MLQKHNKQQTTQIIMPTLRTHVQVVMSLFGSRENGLASYKGIIFP
jgi:hypothetical protein